MRELDALAKALSEEEPYFIRPLKGLTAEFDQVRVTHVAVIRWSTFWEARQYAPSPTAAMVGANTGAT